MAIAALTLRVGGVTVIEKAQATKALVLRAPWGLPLLRRVAGVAMRARGGWGGGLAIALAWKQAVTQ